MAPSTLVRYAWIESALVTVIPFLCAFAVGAALAHGEVGIALGAWVYYTTLLMINAGCALRLWRQVSAGQTMPPAWIILTALLVLQISVSGVRALPY